MAIPVLMPRQGQSVETCIMGQWHKNVGDQVSPGDILFSYETDKASFEEEAKAEGVLLARFFEEGDEVPVLVNVAVIGKPGEEINEFRPGAARAETTPPAPAEEARVIEFPVETISGTTGRIRISPLARNMAESLGIDISGIEGSGPHGRIIARDIEGAQNTEKVIEIQVEKLAIQQVDQTSSMPAAVIASANQIYGEDFDVKSIPNIRKLIAKAMYQSLHNSAQLTHHLSADARQILALRKKLKKEFEEGKISQNITINDIVCFAVIRALKKFPQVNTHYLGDKMKWFKKVHLANAVDTDRGLMVPVVKNADDLSLAGLSSQLQQLAASCRKGSVDPDLLKPEAGTFTVSNLGNYGVEIFTPVINLPQTAILGVCTIIPRPRDLGDGVYGFVPMIGLSLTYDHQALDGGEATRFLAEIKLEIEEFRV